MHTSLESGAFCVVCGRFDRELVQRKSGLKCTTCVGRRSNKGYVELQHQQATYMLSLYLPRQASGLGVGAPGSPQSPHFQNQRLAQTTVPGSQGRGRGQADLYGVGSPLMAGSFGATGRPSSPFGNSTAAAATGGGGGSGPGSLHGSTGGNGGGLQLNTNFDIDDLAVTVEDAVTQNVECERSLLNATITTNETATTYQFTTRDRATCTEVAVRRHRFKEAVRVFEALKLIGGSSLPEVPEKRIFARFEPKFIEERRQQMERFLNAAVANSFLVRHPQLLGFLGLEPLVREQQRLANEARVAMGNTMTLRGSMAGAPGGGAFGVNPADVGELPPEELSKCRLGTLLGRGAFGSVFLGLLHSSSQLVAVKVVHVGKDVDNSKIMALHQELEMLRNLNHPNIVRFHGALWSEEKKELSIFTEYIECGSIANMIGKFGALPMPVVQRYLFQTLRGLQYLHSMDIVHLDIKGANILATKSGQVKLADFGCSGHLSQLHAVGGELAGTPMWMAPEAMRGEPATTAADIWSLGCVGIEMLQRKIWNIDERENVYTAMFKIQKAGTPPTGLPAEGEVHPLYHDFLLKCLAMDPKARPTAGQLLEHPFFTADLEDVATPRAGSGGGTSGGGGGGGCVGGGGGHGTDDEAQLLPSPRGAQSPLASPRPQSAGGLAKDPLL